MKTTGAADQKPITGPSALAALMIEMESTKGFDPMPPDQYRYFLGKKESPLQRLLALVRARTIARGHRSAYCVDEIGRELRQADLRRELAMDWGNFRRAFAEAIARKLIRMGSRSSPTDGGPDRPHRKNGGASSHPNRVYLCGSIKESVGYKYTEEGGTSLYRLVLLTPTQRKLYDGWPAEKQARFYAEFEAAVNRKDQIEREALARARAVAAPIVDAVLSMHGLPVKRLKSVQTESVPTDDRESVPSAPSLLPLENSESVPSTSSTTTGDAKPTPAARDDAALPSIEETARKAAGFERLSAADREFCREMAPKFAPETVRAGIIMGRARQLVAATNRGSPARISSLRYFAGSIEEAHGGFDAGYIEYLDHKLRRHTHTKSKGANA